MRALPCGSRRSLSLLPVVVLLSACAVSRPGSELAAPSSRLMITSDVVSGVEIQSAGPTSAFDALRRTRPSMLLHRAAVSIGDPYDGAPVLYVDRVLQGKVELLQSVPADAVREVRYLSATEGKNEMGAYHPGGIIAVTTRR